MANKFIRKLRKTFLIFSQKTGFNFLELVTSVGIVGTLSVVGIKSYRSQTAKTQTTTAKYNLSYVVTAEKTFYDTWTAYHENLALVGAVPDGTYSYDVGFGSTAPISHGDPADGTLEEYPDSKSKHSNS